MAVTYQDRRINAELLGQVYRQMPTGLLATVVNSTILAFILRTVVSRPILISWLLAIMSLSLLRYLLFRAYRRQTQIIEGFHRWNRLFVVGLCLSGTLWGATAVVLFPIQSVAHQAFIAFALAGMVAGSVGAFSSVSAAFPAFAMPVLIPLMARCLIIGDEIHLAMGAMVSLFGILMFLMARRMRVANRELVKLRDNFADKVEERTFELSKANDELRKEIAERKRVENALQLSQQDWETTFNAMSDWVSVIDAESRVLRTNRVGELFLGLSVKKIIGQPCYKLVHGTDRPIARCPFPEVLRTGRRGSAELQMADGRWVKVTVDPVKNQDGVVIRGVHTVSDISDRKKAEEALRESEEKFRAIAESAQDAIFCKDTDGRYIFVNPAMEKLLGYSLSHIRRKTAQNFLPHDEASIIAKADQRTLSGEVVRCERGFILNGNERTFNVIQVPLRDDTGRIFGLSGIARDITETKRMEAQLRQVHKAEAISALAGGIAHQFNNALSYITGNIELLEMNAAEKENIVKFSKPMKDATYRMADLTSQLLAYARGGKYQSRMISPSDFVKNTLPLVKHTIDPAIRIDTDLPKNVSNIKADLTQMQMVLSALLSNASEAMDGKGRISISTENEQIDEAFARKHPGMKPGCYITLTVQDDGRGMDEQTRKRVFEPFFTTKFEGRGLGMAAVYGIVKNHEGYVLVESEPGKGTSVRIYLPAAEGWVEERKPSEGIIRGTGTILVVEDDEMVMDVTANMLETLGYRVLTATTGREAVHMAKDYHGFIDLVILDNVLPDMKGKTTSTLLTDVRPDLKVIMCSGYSSEDLDEEMLESGIRGLVQKPFSMGVLSEIINNVLGGQSGNKATA
jgi:two-component system cell cycle sensor histidine kinase/response regulator CckA